MNDDQPELPGATDPKQDLLGHVGAIIGEPVEQAVVFAFDRDGHPHLLGAGHRHASDIVGMLEFAKLLVERRFIRALDAADRRTGDDKS